MTIDEIDKAIEAAWKATAYWRVRAQTAVRNFRE